MIKQVFRWLWKMCGETLKWGILFCIGLYQCVLRSHGIGGGCRFTPTCSHYACQAILTHGLWRGGRRALRRLLRCHPWSRP
jgi:putative membrane protein insertion efficiency factor